LWALAFLAPLVVGAGLVAWQAGEWTILARAKTSLDAGLPERALQELKPLAGRPLLSSAARRRGAALYFQLGQDEDAHGLLRGQAYNGRDPADAELRELAGKCVRAVRSLESADRTRNPAERLRLVRSAREELPDAPLVLQRVVLEELAAVTSAASPAEAERLMQEYLQDYADLRVKAPSLADSVRRQHEKALASLRDR
jgi:hypothetical protein